MMSMRMAFPRLGFTAKRQRYDELIDTVKVVKEQLEKERREKRKEYWGHKWNNKKSEEQKYTPTATATATATLKKKRHLELEPKKIVYDDYYYYTSSSSSSERSRRRKRRRDEHEDEHESKPFERRSCCSLMSWEKKKVPVTTSAYDIDSTSNNNNDNKTKTNNEEELSSSTSSETSSSSSSSCGINDEEEITTNKGSSWCLEKEELEYKKLELEKMVPFNYAASASTLPPLDLDWLYPKTTARKLDEDERRRGEKGLQQRKISSSLSLSSSDDADQNRFMGPHAQYLHEVHIFALPYVLPF